jgi:hypothetical protein
MGFGPGGHLCASHLEGAFDHVVGTARRNESQFQHYLPTRADEPGAAGKPVDWWG